MKDISLYTVMVSLKLKEKRELQNWAKKTLSQKYSDNAVKVFQKYLRGEAGAEEDLLRMSGIETVLRQIYKDEAGSVFKKYLQGGDEVVESLLQMADNGEVQITRELVDSLNKAMREEKVPMPAECMMELYHSEDEFLVKMSKEYAVINYGDYVYECIHKYYSTYATYHLTELYQCGVIGILKAMERYDPASHAFITYAKPYIQHELSNLVNFYNNGISVHYNAIQKKIKTAVDQLNEEGYAVTAQKISLLTDIKPEIVRRELNYMQRTNFQYLDDPDTNIDVPCPYNSTPSAIAEMNEKNRSLYASLLNLDEMTRTVIVLSTDGYTYEQISKNMDISVGKVKTALTNGIRQLRKDKNLKKAYSDMMSEAESEMMQYETPITETEKSAKAQCISCLSSMNSMAGMAPGETFEFSGTFSILE